MAINVTEWERKKRGYDRYLQWLQQPRTDGTGDGEPRGPSVVRYLIPFTRSLGANGVVMTRVSQEAVSQMGTAIGSKAKATLGGNDIPQFIRKFKPARIVMISGRNQSGVVKTSKRTGLKYLSYGGKSYTHPFGRPTANSTDTMYETYAEIRAQLAQQPNRSFTLKDEVPGT
jgi:lysophospholipase L1-like esterase